jgi:hypothetical protein
MIRQLNRVNQQLDDIVSLLTKIEEHLRALTLPPDLTQYKRKDFD